MSLIPIPTARPALAAAVTLALVAGASAQETRSVELAMHYSQEQAAPLLECLKRYRKETGIEAIYTQLSYRDYLQTVLTSRIAGQAPDIYHLYSIWAAQLVDNGVLAEPPDSLAGFVEDNYAAGTVQAATIDDTLWGVPSEVSSYLLVSNMKLLRDAGFDEPPTTWDGFKQTAQAITTRDAQGRIETAGFALADSSTGAGVVHPFYTQMFSAGVNPYEEGYASSNLASDAAVDAVTRMKGLFDDGIADRTVDGYDFPAGGIGMIIMANWLESDIRAGFGDAFADDVQVSQLPFGEAWKTMQYAFFYGVDSGSKNTQEAWDLIRWLNSPESASTEGGPSCTGEMLAGFGSMTANATDLAALGEPNGFQQPFINALEDGRALPQPNVLQAAEIERLMADSIGSALDGGTEPREAMQRLASEVDDILSEFY